ncbi:hypothetical protein FB472_2276 [Rhodoglobus vestalii]|uniref:Uncharacterized protein n=2 Tax=Rhodoglobus vestalii TaxID=193384 RepID=A0A8H2KAG5_9MICO|nr:hypothetical protein FB472_2276 [Rhodoglobus vestalii]
MAVKQTYANSVSYATPSCLDALRGPTGGIIELPRALYWGPEQYVDLTDHSDLQRMYQAVIRIGTREDQETWLDADLLLDIWDSLVLPQRCIETWESTFVQLKGHSWR